MTHEGEGLAQMQQFLGIVPQDLVWSGGQGWAVEEVTAITHTGTHVDAPYHYGAASGGKPARRIDEVPLKWCFAPGVVLDVRHMAAGQEITVADLEAAGVLSPGQDCTGQRRLVPGRRPGSRVTTSLRTQAICHEGSEMSRR